MLTFILYALGEKLAESEEDLLEHRTDGSDAFDTLYIGCEKFPYHDTFAINFLIDVDIDGFNEYLESYEFLDFGELEIFDTEAQALAFCKGLGYGSDERAVPDRYPLRSCEPADTPFIEAIENY